MRNKKAHELVTTGQPNDPAFPARMVLRFPSCSPRRPGFVVSVRRVMRSIIATLIISVGISGPHDFAVRGFALRRSRNPRPSHSPSNVRDDRETPLFAGQGMRGILPVICAHSNCDRLTRRANQLACAKSCQVNSNCCFSSFRDAPKAQTRNPSLLTFARHNGFRAQPCGQPRNDDGSATPLAPNAQAPSARQRRRRIRRSPSGNPPQQG